MQAPAAWDATTKRRGRGEGDHRELTIADGGVEVTKAVNRQLFPAIPAARLRRFCGARTVDGIVRTVPAPFDPLLSIDADTERSGSIQVEGRRGGSTGMSGSGTLE